MRPHLIARLEAGVALALVSDAGTPLVSDPGFKLVHEALAAGVKVTSIPGASAVLAALVVPACDRPVLFRGFLPHKSGPRRARLASSRVYRHAGVFRKAPAGSPRRCKTASPRRRPRGRHRRELTKVFETVRRGSTPNWRPLWRGRNRPRARSCC